MQTERKSAEVSPRNRGEEQVDKEGSVFKLGTEFMEWWWSGMSAIACGDDRGRIECLSSRSCVYG